MTNKKIGFYFESSLPEIPSNDDFAFYYIKNEQQINGENKNIPDVYLYNKSLNQYFQINKPANLDLRTINYLPILDNNIDLGLNDILNFNNETDIPLNLNGNLLYSKLNSLFFTNRNIPTDENVDNSIIFGTNFGNQEVIVKSNNDIYFGNNINISNPSMSNIVIGNDIELQNQTIDFNNNIFIGGSYDFETESIYYGKIATPAVPKIENNIFIKNLGFGNTQHFFKFVAPLVLSNNTKIIDIDNNNENDSLLYDNILVAKNNGLIGIKRINSFDFIPTLSQVLTKSGKSNTVTVENINVENLKFNNYENNESISLDNKIGYLIIDNTGKILWKELENKPTLESVILENPIANTKPIFNEVEISNKLYVKNLTNKNNDILFDKLIIANSNGELAQISKNNLLSEKQNVLDYNPENSANKSDSYTNSSSVTYSSTKALVDGLATKLDKGTYTGNASDLFLNYQNLLQSLQNEQSARYYADQGLENSKQKKVTVIPITGNITLSEIHNGAILHITNTCNITIPTGLGANFTWDAYVEGSFNATYVNGGVTLHAPDGLILKAEKMCTGFVTSTGKVILKGELATS